MMARSTDAEFFLSRLPEDGNSVGNQTFMRTLNWEHKPDRYWEVRDELYAEGEIGIGRGRGGSVRRIVEDVADAEVGDEEAAASSDDVTYPDEASLYEDFRVTMDQNFIKGLGIQQYASEITAHQGRRQTGGGWSRPDVVFLTIEKYQYVPNTVMTIYSFELKHYSAFSIYGVFETAAHARIANKPYYCVYLPDGWKDDEESARIKSECERLGLGLLVFSDPKAYDTYEFILDPPRGNPEPGDQDEFIRVQIRHPENLRNLALWAR